MRILVTPNDNIVPLDKIEMIHYQQYNKEGTVTLITTRSAETLFKGRISEARKVLTDLQKYLVGRAKMIRIICGEVSAGAW